MLLKVHASLELKHLYLVSHFKSSSYLAIFKSTIKSIQMLMQIIIASACILVTLYGVIKKNRVLFNTGYFVYGLIVIGSEFNFYSQNLETIHLANAILWMIQSSLTIPNKLSYDGSKLAKSAAIKIYVCLVLINLFGIYLVRTSDVPDLAQYFHIVLAILPLVAIYMILNNRVAIDK